MKIAVITAIFGSTDKKRPFCPQSMPEGVKVERFVFSEDNSPIPLPNLPPRLQAKYFKTQSHRIPALHGYDVHVWIDGNIEVTNKGFVAALIYPLFSGNNTRIVIQAHHERQTIEQEIGFILDSMDNPYLSIRYGAQPLEDEYNSYLNNGMPPTAKLYSCNVFARKLGRVSNELFDEWWRLCIEWSWFDQSAFSYIASRAEDVVAVVDMGGVCTSPYYTLHSHTQWNK
jgi:hypothetical protein